MLKHTCFLLAAVGLSVSSSLADTTYMSGMVPMVRLELVAGDQIIATCDLQIICTNDAIIDGIIIGDPGASIEILTFGTIEISGSISAGDGTLGLEVEEAGENGGEVILDATNIVLRTCTITSGEGGNAGPSGNGGMGGDISLISDVIGIGGGALRLFRLVWAVGAATASMATLRSLGMAA